MEEKMIVLIGGGGHCHSVLDVLLECYEYDDIVITDYNTDGTTVYRGIEVIGDDSLLPELQKKGFKEAFITIGSIKSTEKRRKAYIISNSYGFFYPVIVDRTAAISKQSKLKNGVFVGKNAIVNTDTIIGEFAIINSGSIIEHDCFIGDFTHVAVGAIVCGNCYIEHDVFIGANATVAQGVRVGMNSIIGAGSVVLKDVPANTIVCGVWRGKAI